MVSKASSHVLSSIDLEKIGYSLNVCVIDEYTHIAWVSPPDSPRSFPKNIEVTNDGDGILDDDTIYMKLRQYLAELEQTIIISPIYKYNYAGCETISSY